MAAENKIFNNGTIQIGNSASEEHKLKVFHSDNTYVEIYGYGIYMSRTNSYIRPTSDGGQILAIGTDNNTWNYVALDTNYFTVSTNATEHFRITNTGNVGIGTSSPNTFLHIAGQGNRSGGQIYLGNQDDGSVKYSLITSAHYNAATEPEGFTLITGLSTATENTVSIGGFVYESNPATDIRFFTHTATTHTTGGSERMRITSSGNVGIGTNSPGSTLEVDGSFNVVNGNNSITHFNYVDGSTNYVRGITYFDNASAYFTGGNVGIGTTSPSHKLHVEGFIATNDSSNASGLLIRKAGSTIGFVGQSGGWVGDTTDDLALSGETGKNIRFYTNGSITERMRITSTGNVGIGTDSPARTLHVVGGDSGTGTHIAHFEGRFGVVGMYIRGDGNVGIGTTSPNLKLHLAHSDGNNGLLLEHTSQASGYQILQNIRETEGLIWQRWTNGVFSANFMTLDYSGNVGIGTTSPGSAFKLDVNGYIKANSRVYVRDSTKTVEIGTDYIQSYVTSGTGVNPIRFFTGSTEKARVDGNGNVGIGTSTPERQLSLYSDDTETTPRLLIEQDGTGNRAFSESLDSAGSMLFAGGTSTLSTAGGSTDIMSIVYAGGVYYASLSTNFS